MSYFSIVVAASEGGANVFKVSYFKGKSNEHIEYRIGNENDCVLISLFLYKLRVKIGNQFGGSRFS